MMIMAWKKVFDTGDQILYVSGKRKIIITDEGRIKKWVIGIKSRDNKKTLLNKEFDRKKEVISFAKKWMKKHPNG